MEDGWKACEQFECLFPLSACVPAFFQCYDLTSYRLKKPQSRTEITISLVYKVNDLITANYFPINLLSAFVVVYFVAFPLVSRFNIRTAHDKPINKVKKCINRIFLTYLIGMCHFIGGIVCVFWYEKVCFVSAIHAFHYATQCKFLNC